MNIENELIIYSLKGGCYMTNWQIVNHRLQNLSLHNLKEICYAHNISMEERDLELILQIIKNNPYSSSYNNLILLLTFPNNNPPFSP